MKYFGGIDKWQAIQINHSKIRLFIVSMSVITAKAEILKEL